MPEKLGVHKVEWKKRFPPAKARTMVNAPTSAHVEGVLRIYTDGACSSNGRAGAVAGWGVHFPDGEFEDLYGRLRGSPQTNQRAELTAILRALALVNSLVFPAAKSCRIYTDSSYSINCVTNWIKNWKKNGWMNSKKQPVLNSDLIREIDGLLQTSSLKGRIEFIHVRGHVNDPLNDKADALARLGAGGSEQLTTIDRRNLLG